MFWITAATMPPLHRPLFRTTNLPHIVLFVAFGLWLPWVKGVGFLDAAVLGAYACLGVVFAAPSAAFNAIFRPALLGLVWSWGMLLTGIAVVYLTRNVVVGPDFHSLLACAAFGAALTLAVAALVASVASKTSEFVARIVARTILLALLGAFYLYSGWLPDVAWTGAAISGVIALLLLLLRARRTT